MIAISVMIRTRPACNIDLIGNSRDGPTVTVGKWLINSHAHNSRAYIVLHIQSDKHALKLCITKTFKRFTYSYNFISKIK